MSDTPEEVLSHNQSGKTGQTSAKGASPSVSNQEQKNDSLQPGNSSSYATIAARQPDQVYVFRLLSIMLHFFR